MTIEWQSFDLSTKVPFGIARWTHQSYPRVLVRVRLDGETGLGEAAPNAYYGETRDTVLATLPPFVERCPRDAFAWDELAASLDAVFPHHHHSVKAALEAAFLDLAGRLSGLPLHRLLGLAVPGRATSFTIGIASPEEIRAQARAAVAEGYRILKVKLGSDDDEAILAAVRDGAPDAALRVDANAAWTAGEAIRRLALLDAYQVELLEQPVAAEDLEGLARVTAAARIPVVADEAFRTLGDLKRLRCDGVNVKLSKIGGPRRAMFAMHAARKLGFQVMLGCMIESSLGIAAAAQVASPADWLDLDGALLLAEDPFTGLSWTADKKPLLAPEAGLGVRARDA